MKILQIHNHYKFMGGEDAVVSAEREMLIRHGHTVIPFIKDNADIDTRSDRIFSKTIKLIRTAFQTLWNESVYRQTREILRKHRPDIVHCHNTFPQFSPSVYYACKRENIPVVQTLHNYRLVCLNAYLFRRKHEKESDPNMAKYGICEDCLHRTLKLPGLRHRCYRDSLPGSFVVMCMLLMHQTLGTWKRKIDAYIAVSELTRQKLIESGIIPAADIFTKPNLISTVSYIPAEIQIANCEETFSINTPYALFAGRLSPEKGCAQLIEAWCHFKQQHPSSSCQLIIAGKGPIEKALRQQVMSTAQQDSIRFLGHCTKDHLERLMQNALFLIFPSVWYETFGLTVLEAGINGTASLVASNSAAAAIITDEDTGILFNISDPNDLTNKLAWAFSHPEAMHTMGKRAQEIFNSKFSEQVNYELLMKIYQHAISKASMQIGRYNRSCP